MPGLPGDHHPRDLSEGQRLGLVLAVQLAASPAGASCSTSRPAGLDHLVKEQLTRLLRELAADGRVVVVATHDVEFVAGAADRVVVLADGEIVADGPTADVVVASPAFAPQVAKVLHPDRWLTVDEVAAALGGSTGVTATVVRRDRSVLRMAPRTAVALVGGVGRRAGHVRLAARSSTRRPGSPTSATRPTCSRSCCRRSSSSCSPR